MSDTSAPPATAAISLRQTTPTMKWVGATCPKCQQPIAVGDQVVLCPKCYTPQHAQCWRDNDNRCAIDQTPARLIERPGRGSAGSVAAGTAAAAPAPAPAAAPAAAAPAPVPAAAAAASAVPAPTPLANPWQYARLLEAPPESDLWRRNIMTVVTIVFIWGLLVLIFWAAGTFFGIGPGQV